MSRKIRTINPRKGLGKGKGKGYKNIMGKDPKVHSESARGRKQPQKLKWLQRQESMLKVTPKLKKKSFGQLRRAGVYLSYQGDKDGDGVPNISDCRPLDRTRQDDVEVTEIDEFQEQIEEEGKPLTKRIARLGKRGISYVSELARKHKEDREKFEQEIQNLNDKQLEELAVRYKDDSIFGTSNPYRDELVRRIKVKRELNKKLKEAREDKESGGLF